MIRKANSSEVFDIYANRMISKRDTIKKDAQAVGTEISRLIPRLNNVAQDIGNINIAPGVINSLTGDVKAGIRILSDSPAARASIALEALANAAHINEAATPILRAAQAVGYTETEITPLIKAFETDLQRMSSEYSTLISRSPQPNQQELQSFYTSNKRAIDLYNQINNNQGLKTAITTHAAEGMTAATKGKVNVPAGQISGANTGANAGANAGSVVSDLLTYYRAGSALFSVGMLAAIGFAGYKVVTSELLSKIMNTFSGKDGERHIVAIKDAIDCINNISLIPSSPSVSSREKVINNLETFSALETISEVTDRAEASTIINEGFAAGDQLASDSSVEGSIQNFLFIIANNPGENLRGYSALEVGGASAVVGGGMGGIAGAGGSALVGSSRMKLYGALGAAIGAALAGYIGWHFISNYYENEIMCISSAADAIVQLHNKFVSELEKNKKNSDNTVGIPGGSPGGSPGNGNISNDSFLEQIIGVMQNDKIYNMPGLSNIFVNERRLIRKIIEESGSVSNAAKIISDVNPNIKITLSAIDTSNFSGAITEEVIKNNPQLQSLVKQIIISAKTAKDALKINRASDVNNLQNKFKIKETKMEKQSKSITNHELTRKTAETKVSYFGDASLGLKDQLTKSYYAGLTGMYNESPPKKSSDYKDLYGFNKETGQDLILESHPKSVTLADAMGKGGLVENNLEQQQKSIYVATNTPSGNFQSKYAQTISYLEKLAKAADSQNKKDVSRLIKQTISKLN